MEIYYSTKFEHSLRKLLKSANLFLLNERIEIFKDNPFDPRLKTHRLTGKLKGYWSFSLAHKHRLLFKFDSSHSATFIDIGDHRIYR